MNTRPAQPLFEFQSSDSIAQWCVWVVPLAGGGAFSLIAWDLAGLHVLAAIAVGSIILVAGLRSHICVSTSQVTITRKWFALPYKTYMAQSVEYVSYGGNYGLEEGAIGVVVQLGGRSVHIGNSRNTHFLYKSLLQFSRGNALHAG